MIEAKKHNTTFCYVVNTFSIPDFQPVQLVGEIVADNEEAAVNRLIDNGTIYAKGYEFLELKIKV